MAGEKDPVGVEMVALEAEPEDAPLPLALPETRTQPYELARDQERTRGRIAGGLVGLLSVIVLFFFLTLWWSAVKPDDLKELLTSLIGPAAALAGYANGFYFGGKSNGIA